MLSDKIFEVLDEEDLINFISSSRAVLNRAMQVLGEKTATPPTIVAKSEDPAGALVAFIGQELEAWGFIVTLGNDHQLIVEAGLEVQVY